MCSSAWMCAETDHYACVVTASGEQVLARAVCNDETAVAGLFDAAAARGNPALVIDTTGYDSGAAGARRRPA